MFERYAVYYTFEDALGELGAAWLGWDITAAGKVAHPNLPEVDLDKITARPRKYGLHATIKAPFRLADGCTETDLRRAFAHLCADLRPVAMGRLELTQIGRFLALCAPQGEAAVIPLAASVVQALDRFRAPLSDAELARRNPARLSSAQLYNLNTWGYPHVMQQFRFHVTISAPLKPAELPIATRVAQEYFAPHLGQPFALDALTLVGQDAKGMFHSVVRVPLK